MGNAVWSRVRLDQMEIVTDRSHRAITIYEGDNISGHDAEIVERSRATLPFQSQMPLVDDTDALRLANLTDPGQYRNVSGLRERRMASRCAQALQSCGWVVKTHVKQTSPKRELDMVATIGGQQMILQLKSTLRPASPWEVLKRNKELLCGIRHTAEALRRSPSGTVGIVLTDGYRGDYAVWAEAMKLGVPIATMEDIHEIGARPSEAFSTLKAKVGALDSTNNTKSEDRETSLFGWTLRIVDGPKPAHR